MALYDPIPAALEAAEQRYMAWRLRCAWGGNRLRQRDQAGALMATVAARSSQAGQGPALAVDGFRPHMDPRDPAYAGWWQSDGSPLTRETPATRTYAPVADWDAEGWDEDHSANAASDYGAAAPGGYLSCASSDGSRAYVSMRLGPFARDNKSLLQAVLGCLRNEAGIAPGKYMRVGFAICSDDVGDWKTSAHYLAVYAQATSAGRSLWQDLDGTPTQFQSGEYAPTGEELEAFEHIKFFWDRNSYPAWVMPNFHAPVNQGAATFGASGNVYAVLFLETNVTGATKRVGYFRNFLFASSTKFFCAGEVGWETEFSRFHDGTWDPIDANTVVSQVAAPDKPAVVGGAPYALKLESLVGSWCFARWNLRADVGDFDWEADLKITVTLAGLLFRVQADDPTKCYGVRVSTTGAGLYRGDGGGSFTALDSSATVYAVGHHSVRIQAQGSLIRVWIDEVLEFSATDATWALGTLGVGGFDEAVYWRWTLRERGLNAAARFRLDWPALENPSFDDWMAMGAEESDAADGWGLQVLGATTAQKADGRLEGYAQQIDYPCNGAVSFSNFARLYQYGVPSWNGHSYVVSFWARLSAAAALVGSYRFDVIFNGQTFQLPVDPADLDEWVEYLVPVEATTQEIAEGLFAIYLNCTGGGGTAQAVTFEIDDVMVLDVTDQDDPDLEWTETPTSYRSLPADRFVGLDADYAPDYDHEDEGRAFCLPALAKVWRSGETVTWGLCNEDGQDVFTSRPYMDVLPGEIWTMVPQWLQIDLGADRMVNQVLFYSKYDLGARWLQLTYGDDAWGAGQGVLQVIAQPPSGGLAKMDLEAEAEAVARYWQAVFLDSDLEGADVTCQELELYGFADESDRIVGAEIMASIRRNAGINSLPDAGSFSARLRNDDARFTPRNLASPIYGQRQLDGLGEIRSGVPVRLSVLLHHGADEYETLVMQGTLGTGRRLGGSLGITLDQQSKTATLEGVDFTVGLDEPAPVESLDVDEGATAEDLIRGIAYIANIPEQDLDLDVTGAVIPVAFFADGSLRENVNAILDAIGARAHTLPDGVIVMRNCAPFRSREYTEKADFDLWALTDVRDDLRLGDLVLENSAWGLNWEGGCLPDDDLAHPWDVKDPDASPRRWIQNGRYYVALTRGQRSKMRHVQLAALDEAAGFTLDYRIWVDARDPDGVGYLPDWNLWGYTTDVAGRKTAACAFRFRLYRIGSTLHADGGGALSAVLGTLVPYASAVVADSPGPWLVRVTVAGGEAHLWVNRQLVLTVPLCRPADVRWAPYSEADEQLEDNFTADGFLQTHVPDVNTTGDVWHDPDDDFGCLGGHLGLRHADGRKAYMDFGVPRQLHDVKVFLDGTSAQYAGVKLWYDDEDDFHLLEMTAAEAWAGGPVDVHCKLRKYLSGSWSDVWDLGTARCKSGLQRVEISVLGQQLVLAVTDSDSVRALYVTRIVYGANAARSKFGPYCGAASGAYFDSWKVDPAADYVEVEDEDLVDPDTAAYAAGQVIGPTPAEAAGTGIITPNYRMDWARAALTGEKAYATTGEAVSPVIDLSASVSAFGILEAEYAEDELYWGHLEATGWQWYSRVLFYVATSSDGLSFGAWTAVTPGEIIPGTALRYLKVKAVLSTPYISWRNGEVPSVSSVTVNWLVGTSPYTESLTLGPERFTQAQYAMGDPAGNRVPVRVNHWAEQAIAEIWATSDVPRTVDDGDTYVWTAEYDQPAKRGTGGSARHCHLTVDGTPYSVADGAGETACGNAKVTFDSGSRLGTVSVLADGAAVVVSALSVDSIQFLPASGNGELEQVVAEDEDFRDVFGRTVTADLLDNPFVCSRAVADAYAAAKLRSARRHRESVSGVELALAPSLHLGYLFSLQAPDLGVAARQFTPLGITHDGLRTTIDGEFNPAEEA